MIAVTDRNHAGGVILTTCKTVGNAVDGFGGVVGVAACDETC